MASGVNGVGAAVAGALLLAAVSTLGDLVWAKWIPAHRAGYGLAHGTLLFLVAGLWLGALSGRLAAGGAGGALIGLAAAGSFYALAPWLGWSAMFVSWFALWLALAALAHRLAAAPGSASATAVRGLAAALTSGLAFWAISGIWRSPSPDGPDYPLHLAAWSAAFLPGCLALCLRRGRAPARA